MRRILLESGRGVRLEVEVAESRQERMRGLLGRERLPPGHGLLIPNTRSVHTVRMRFPIEVAFLDDDLSVVAVRLMPAGRLGRPRLRAGHVLECNIGEGPGVGDRLTAMAPQEIATGPVVPVTSHPPEVRSRTSVIHDPHSPPQ